MFTIQINDSCSDGSLKRHNYADLSSDSENDILIQSRLEVQQQSIKGNRGKSKKKKAKKVAKVVEGDKFDPDLLLNFEKVGVEMVVPTSGTHFNFGGYIFKRSNPANPVDNDKQL